MQKVIFFKSVTFIYLYTFSKQSAVLALCSDRIYYGIFHQCILKNKYNTECSTAQKYTKVLKLM